MSRSYSSKLSHIRLTMGDMKTKPGNLRMGNRSEKLRGRDHNDN